jgi:hypothetical protein
MSWAGVRCPFLFSFCLSVGSVLNDALKVTFQGEIVLASCREFTLFPVFAVMSVYRSLSGVQHPRAVSCIPFSRINQL